jgi:hypothetical protein
VYVCGGGMPDKDAASEVLMYAMGGVDHGNKLYNDPSYREQCRKRVNRHLFGRHWKRIDAAVFEYVNECLRTPGHKEREKRPDGSKVKHASAPREWVVVEYIFQMNGGDIEAAWDAPYAQSICLFDAGRDVRGDDDTLISEADEKRIDAKLERMRQAESEAK